MSEDKRRSYRYPIPEGQRKAKLWIGRREFPVLAKDESAGGYQISCNKALQCRPGDIVQIEANSGKFETEVVYIRADGTGSRIGLKRLRSLDDLRNAPSSRHGSDLSRFLLFTVMGAMIMMIVSATTSFDEWVVGRSSQASVSASAWPAFVKDGPMHQELAELDRLMSGEIIEQLDLTNDQQENIQYVFLESSRSLKRLHQAPGENWTDESSKVVESAVRQVLSTMTDEQVLQWANILRDSSQEPEQAATHSEMTGETATVGNIPAAD